MFSSVHGTNLKLQVNIFKTSTALFANYLSPYLPPFFLCLNWSACPHHRWKCCWFLLYFKHWKTFFRVIFLGTGVWVFASVIFLSLFWILTVYTSLLLVSNASHLSLSSLRKSSVCNIVSSSSYILYAI